MNPKLLSDAGWKAVATKFKIKDNGLQRALADYQKLPEEKYDERLKCIGLVCQHAAGLTKAKDAAAQSEVVKYLDTVADAADSEKSAIAQAKLLAARATAAEQKKAKAEEQDAHEEEQEEEEQGEYHVKLLAAFQKLKSAKDVAFQFIVCDAAPHCGLMVAKKITSNHKQELTKITGSKRFLHLGVCRFENGKYVFATEKPVTGLARKLQDSIKSFTGKKLPIMVGTETAEGDEESHAAPNAAVRPPAPQHEAPSLEKAPDHWRGTRDLIGTGLEQLKTAIRREYSSHGPDLVAAIEQSFKKLDLILEKLDHRLADSLAKAHAAKNPEAQRAELINSRNILRQYLTDVAAEPLHGMLAHIDNNPFVSLNLMHVLTERLTHMRQTIGAGAAPNQKS